MKLNLKGISGIVATALLLVVSVVAVIGFQNFYANYQSTTFANAEQKSGSGATGVETVVGNDLYFKNTQSEDMNISKIKINGVECTLDLAERNATANKISKIDVTDCVGSLTSPKAEVMVVTEDEVFTKFVYFKDVKEASVFSGSTGGSGNVTWSINSTGTDTEIFRLFSNLKTHASVATTADVPYGFYLAHDSYSVGLGCSGTYDTLFYLGDTNNSHVWIDNSSAQAGPSYNWQQVCINTNAPAIDIALNTSDMTSLNYTGLLSIHRNDSLGGTISQFSDSDLPTKIWIKFGN